MLSPGARRGALTAHVTVSVGWTGAVVAFLVLAVAGLASADPLLVRSSQVAAELVTWWAIVPLALASLLTGVVSSLGTSWGLGRHYWVVVKLVVTVLATLVLLVHTGPISSLADQAAGSGPGGTEHGGAQATLVAQAAAAMLVLVVLTGLSVVKPRGLTRRGVRLAGQQRPRRPPVVTTAPG